MFGKPHIFYYFPKSFNKFISTGISLEASLDVMRITKALIRLHMRRLQAGLPLCCSQTP